MRWKWIHQSNRVLCHFDFCPKKQATQSVCEFQSYLTHTTHVYIYGACQNVIKVSTPWNKNSSLSLLLLHNPLNRPCCCCVSSLLLYIWIFYAVCRLLATNVATLQMGLWHSHINQITQHFGCGQGFRTPLSLCVCVFSLYIYENYRLLKGSQQQQLHDFSL